MSPLAAGFRALKSMGPDAHDPLHTGRSASFGILHLPRDDRSKTKGGAPFSLAKTPTLSDELIRAVVTHEHRDKSFLIPSIWSSMMKMQGNNEK